MSFQIVSLELKYLSISFYTSEIFLKVAASKKNVADFFVLHILRFEIFVYAYNSLFCNTTLAASLNVKRNNRKRLTFHLKHLRPHSRLHKLCSCTNSCLMPPHTSHHILPLFYNLCIILYILSNICALKGNDKIPK